MIFRDLPSAYLPSLPGGWVGQPSEAPRAPNYVMLDQKDAEPPRSYIAAPGTGSGQDRGSFTRLLSGNPIANIWGTGNPVLIGATALAAVGVLYFLFKK
jgi:hypothetical protein